MAITELAAIEAAYQALQPLSPGARRRAVRWLADALETEDDLALSAPAFPGVPAVAPVPQQSAAPSGGFAAQPATPASTVSLPTGAVPGARRPGRGRRPAARNTGSTTTGVAAPTGTAGGTAAGTTGGTGTGTAGGTGSRATATAVPPRQRRRPGRPDNDRAYRRMPTADEVMAAYRSVGTVTGLAEYFNVPTHTVQGWARRLRGQGYQIGRGARDA